MDEDKNPAAGEQVAEDAQRNPTRAIDGLAVVF